MFADLEAKKTTMSSFNMSPSQIREEMYVEIFATYVANEISLRSETKTAVRRWIDSISKGFIDGGGETGKVMRKLAESLREDVIGTSDVAVTNEIFEIPEAEVSAINDIEQNVLDAANLSSEAQDRHSSTIRLSPSTLCQPAGTLACLTLLTYRLRHSTITSILSTGTER